jgi:hypothetical protein
LALDISRVGRVIYRTIIAEQQITVSRRATPSIGDSQGDRDEVAVFIENQEYVFGLSGFEQFRYRDAERLKAEASKAPHEGRPLTNVKSQPGDLDLTIYGCAGSSRCHSPATPAWLRCSTQWVRRS